ncbi:MAG: ADP-ribosylglycohydrolase family protein [Spirochaetaceae bacterium]|nr:ADP-ribosylglycohydrolase family protein [Spirochaetaceae bacterium]
MVELSQEIRERVYAGVLGKLIGVYLGRAVEGWSYRAIRERFGEIANFVHHEVGMPLIVPDDDLSGTFVFFRALEDHGYDPALSARQIGETWLNYIIEDKTILWWGGMSRSTEHTAWLRLRQGHAAPASGSIALNGRAMAEQIGAQIFADGWALANPGAPARAARLAREAARVSHDGIAVDCAEFLAVLEALAFEEADAGRLLEQGLGFVGNAMLRGLVSAVRDRCAAAGDWREVRDWIEREHGYHRYPGNCPMVTNHLSVLMALLLSGADFQRSLTIAASAGWDTDCNAGNVGCLNGVRLGLAALSAGVDLRAPVADRLYAVSADGGECVTDAVLETRRILRAAAALRGEEQPPRQPRFGFEFPGAVQGFRADREPHHLQAVTGLRNDGSGLQISYAWLAPGRYGRLRVQTCFAPEPSGVRDTSYFEVLASPTLYGTQTVRALVECGAGPQPSWRFFVRHYRGDGSLDTRYGEVVALQPGANRLSWKVPHCDGLPIYELGIELTAPGRLDGEVILRQLDWHGAPERLAMGRADELSPELTPWTTNTPWLKAFLSSARNLAPDYTTTFSISHPDDNGVLTIGTREWDDYTVSSELTLVHQRAAGLVARARGHRRYYAGVLCGGEARLVKRRDGTVQVLARCPCDAPHDQPLEVALTVVGEELRFALGSRALLAARDGEYASGGAGFLVEEGGYLASGFRVERAARDGGDGP